MDYHGIKYTRTEGTHLAVTALHGLGENHTSLAPQLQYLCTDPQRPSVAMTFRAQGQSTQDGIVSIPRHADDLAGILDEEEIPQTDLMGFSMGALVALEFAHRHPNRVRKLALICPGMAGDGYFTHLFKAVQAVMENPLVRYVAEKDTIPRLEIDLGASPANIYTATLHRWMATPARGFYRNMDAVREYGKPRYLKEIPHDTLIVAATKDELVSNTASETLQREIPRSRHVRLVGGHVIMRAREQKLNRLLKRHFAL